jgi:hypothetical protein
VGQHQPQVPSDSLPAGLKRRVVDEQTAAQMLYSDGQPVMAVGIPLPDVGATFFEFVPLDELSRTLGSVRVSLLGAVAITTAAGVLLGAVAARRAVQPLADAAQAAQGQGPSFVELSTRLAGAIDLRCWPGRSTTWRRAAAAGRARRAGSRPTSATSCGRPHDARLLGRGAQQPRDELPDKARRRST